MTELTSAQQSLLAFPFVTPLQPSLLQQQPHFTQLLQDITTQCAPYTVNESVEHACVKSVFPSADVTALQEQFILMEHERAVYLQQLLLYEQLKALVNEHRVATLHKQSQPVAQSHHPPITDSGALDTLCQRWDVAHTLPLLQLDMQTSHTAPTHSSLLGLNRTWIVNTAQQQQTGDNAAAAVASQHTSTTDSVDISPAIHSALLTRLNALSTQLQLLCSTQVDFTAVSDSQKENNPQAANRNHKTQQQGALKTHSRTNSSTQRPAHNTSTNALSCPLSNELHSAYAAHLCALSELQRVKGAVAAQTVAYVQSLLQCMQELVNLIQDAKLSKQFEQDQVWKDHLQVKLQAVTAKINLLRYDYMAATYTADTLPALQQISQSVNDTLQQRTVQYSTMRDERDAYAAMGLGFESLVQEYMQITERIKNKEWSLKHMS